MSSPEVEKFEVTDYDLANEFNPNRRYRRQTKNQATYGIWADPESDEEEERPRFGKTGSAMSSNDYTMNFVSGGLKQEEKLPQKDDLDSEDDSEEETAVKVPQKKIVPVKAPRRFAGSKDFESDKNFGKWEKHTRGIGQKLLEKMGYEKGKGLGKAAQGITAPIEAVKRRRRAGLEFNGSERTQQSLKHYPVQDSDEEEETEFKNELHQWKREPTGNNRKPKYVYKTAQDVIESGLTRKKRPIQSSELSKVKVIDMTGKEKRVLSGYHAICQRHDKPDEDDDVIESTPKARTAFDVPELVHNLNILVNMSEVDIIQNDRKLRFNKDQIVNVTHEKERLDVVCEQEKKQCDRLQGILDMVESCQKRTQADYEDAMSLDECVSLFKKLQEEYYEEYKLYDLGALAIALVFPMMKQFFSSWEPLKENTKGLEVMGEWRCILEDSNHKYTYDANNMDVYQRLVWDIWMPVIRKTILQWNVRECNPLIDLLEVWMPVLPSWILDNIQDQLILPRLMQEVENWNPLTDTMPIHAWLHPWLPLMGDKLEPLYAPIRHKLANALNKWHPSDSSAKVILQPWVSVFKPGHMEGFLVKNILPKIELCMQEFVINPHQQILEPLHWMMSWRDIIALPHLISILEKNLFPKWLQVLCTWLSNMPNYEEVTNWYLGWKSQFPEEFLNHAYVKDQFNRALDIMNRAATGYFQPGAKENMAYFAHNERRQMGTISAPPPPPPSAVLNMIPPTSGVSHHPPPDYDRNPSYPSSFKELVEKMAIDHNLVFIPIPGKSHEGKQVYRFGSVVMYLDRNVIFMFDSQSWIPVSLNTLIDRGKH
ncbi:tuftelin-interacting protein 11 [Octopus bimaculoides]|uniref:G-patch domain-containing protein n=1 Tax=Octopus bimaculoides TaxID=37653 RepID=A0A0L8GRM4_OCTBM|nr:tuftelin-interacting protein 11 [Octopus bimaculoides]XP_014778584.1 tuftelin-interacting protein 11 [Octopus bimaculoides]|eukprot:XP_014778583.1 PREDICTED: tuftelin-interacting protein 11-like [Octopus bimaculoides]